MSGRAAAPVKALPGLVLGGEPRVDLLPPEVLQATKAKGTRRILVMVAILAVLAMGGGYGVALVRATGAQAALAESQARTLELLSEQGEYADATRYAGLLAATEQTLTLATTNEIIWADIFDVVTKYLAPNSYSDWTSEAPLPWEPALVPDGPLREQRVATMNVKILTLAPIDALPLFAKLEEIEGFADASVDKVAIPESGVGYETTITINVYVGALAGRFVETEEEVSE